jgi:magnesium-protoporphyrin O-methyltransferase
MSDSYTKTRDRLETYFDQTASKAWELLTTELPVSGIRSQVRAGREKMRNILLSSLPKNLSNCRVLDAGCGTGQSSIELANRGAEVIGVDISNSLIKVAKKRLPKKLEGSVRFQVGDMLSQECGNFDYVLAMDSLIHYSAYDIVKTLSNFSQRTSKSISFTVVPKTLLLSSLLTFGKILPKSDRSPQVSPVSYKELINAVNAEDCLKDWNLKSLNRVKANFYVSEAMILEL